MLSRPGHSLAELLVALVLAGVILAAATGSLLRQQRTTASLASLGRSAARLRTATALVPAQLALMAPSVADIVPGEARDTALQLRVALATGLACDSAGTLALSVDSGAYPSGAAATLPRAGDSLWWFAADSARWLGRRVTDAWPDARPCASLDGGGGGGPRAVVGFRTEPDAPLPARAPLRVTRQLRFSVYRAGDGTWQLGLREWNDALGALAPVQPVAGPFQRTATDGATTGFRYYAADGAALTPAADPGALSRVARVRFIALGPPGAGWASPPAPRDSMDIVLGP